MGLRRAGSSYRLPAPFVRGKHKQIIPEKNNVDERANK